MNVGYKLNLLVYPVLQIFFFAGAMFFGTAHWVVLILFVFMAAIFMSLSLHISFHHHVHHQPKNKLLKRLIDFIITINLGLPFHFYRLQHLNHHKYNNEVGDMTSTYEEVDNITNPKPFFKYVFLWFLNPEKLQTHIRNAIVEGYFSEMDHRKMIQESFINLLVLIVLFYFYWVYALLYGVMFYLGWSFIALHNYGQHLPTEKHQMAFSYYGKLYNRLFMNNGLHYEHHIYPQVGYWDLKVEKDIMRTNKYPHPVDGILFKNEENENE